MRRPVRKLAKRHQGPKHYVMYTPFDCNVMGNA